MAAESRSEAPPVDASGAGSDASPSGDADLDGALDELERTLRAAPRSFEFFRAVLLLQRLAPDRDKVGGYGEPAKEAVRFGANPSLAFPTSGIHDLEPGGVGADTGEGDPDRLVVNFMGLVGPQGELPHWYTTLVAERERAGDHAVLAFLDLFHHRMLSLFYLAWRRTRFLVAMEETGDDPLTEHLLDLVGTGLPSLREDLHLDRRTLAFYAGLLAPQQRSAQALEQLVADRFGVPAEVEQFVGAWHPVERRDRCTLGEDGPSGRLGVGTVVGDEIWDQGARVQIRVGPLSRKAYRRFLPGGDAHRELGAITRFFGRGEFEFELRPVLRAEDVQGVVLGAEEAESQPLGWSTWIRTRPRSRDGDETILALRRTRS